MPAAPDGLIATVAPSAAVGSDRTSSPGPAPADHGAAITDYLIQRSTDGTNWRTIDDGVSTSRSYTATGLINGTTYGFRVTAINGLGQGESSAPIQATPRWKPTAPAGLAASSPASRHVRLTWKAPSSSDGSPVTDYVIQRSNKGTAWTTIRDGVSTARAYMVTRLSNGITYRFRVAAKNAVGVGPWSTVVRGPPRSLTSRMKAFSSASGSWWAASQSCGETIGWQLHRVLVLTARAEGVEPVRGSI